MARPRRPWRLRGTGRGFCLGLAGAAFAVTAVVFGRADALMAGVTLLSAVVASWFYAYFARPPAALERTIASGTRTPGEVVEVRLVPVRSTGKPPPADCVQDSTPWRAFSAETQQTNTAGQSGGPLSDGLLSYCFRAPARGAYLIGPALITLPGPLDLVRAVYSTAPPARLLVGPALVDVAVPLPDTESDLPQTRSQAGAERVTEPAAVRSYQSGDPRRLVHWKATARRDRLMVREVVLRGLPETWVLADNLASSGSHAEMALSISASVSLRLLRTGHTVNLVWLARRQDGDGGGVIGESSQARFEPAGGPARLLETFAQIQLTPTGGTPDEQLSQRILAQISPQGAVAPVYGALASADGQIMTELGHLAPVATPGRLWLTGPGDLASGASAALRRQGWQVSVGA